MRPAGGEEAVAARETHGMQRGPESAGGARHVAIIMDGNGRWARAHHLPRAMGHRRGVWKRCASWCAGSLRWAWNA